MKERAAELKMLLTEFSNIDRIRDRRKQLAPHLDESTFWLRCLSPWPESMESRNLDETDTRPVLNFYTYTPPRLLLGRSENKRCSNVDYAIVQAHEEWTSYHPWHMETKREEIQRKSAGFGESSECKELCGYSRCSGSGFLINVVILWIETITDEIFSTIHESRVMRDLWMVLTPGDCSGVHFRILYRDCTCRDVTEDYAVRQLGHGITKLTPALLANKSPIEVATNYKCAPYGSAKEWWFPLLEKYRSAPAKLPAQASTSRIPQSGANENDSYLAQRRMLYPLHVFEREKASRFSE